LEIPSISNGAFYSSTVGTIVTIVKMLISGYSLIIIQDT